MRVVEKFKNLVLPVIFAGFLAACSFDVPNEKVCVKDEKILPAFGVLPPRESTSQVAHLETQLCDDVIHTDSVTLFFANADGLGRIDAMTYDRASMSTDPVITWRTDGSVDVRLNLAHDYSTASPSPKLAIHVKVDRVE